MTGLTLIDKEGSYVRRGVEGTFFLKTFNFVSLVRFLTSSSAAKNSRGRVPRLTSDNVLPHIDRAGRP